MTRLGQIWACTSAAYFVGRSRLSVLDLSVIAHVLWQDKSALNLLVEMGLHTLYLYSCDSDLDR